MKPNTTQPRWAVIQAFQHQQSLKVQSQNFPPPGWVYYPAPPVPAQFHCPRQSCSESAEGDSPDFRASSSTDTKSSTGDDLVDNGGPNSIGSSTAPDPPFPSHMRYGFTEREPQMFVHRSTLGAVGLSALAALFVIEFGWWITQ